MRPPERTSNPSVAARIVTCLRDRAKEARVSDVRIGLGYTAVMLADGRTGVAFTFRDQARGGCSVFNGIRPLLTRPAADLLALLESQDAMTSVINQTVDNLLEAARRCREVVLLGASTPLLAEVFDGLRVTMLSGVVVKKPDEVLRVVSEGGGQRQFGPHVRKVTVRVATLEPLSARFSQ